MGFNTEIRKVQNDDLPLSRRFVALRYAVERFSPKGFKTTFDNLEKAIGVADPGEWTAPELGRAVELLCQSRAHYNRHRANWDRERTQNKTAGEQTPTEAELGAFEDASWFDHISDGPDSRPRAVSLHQWVLARELTPGPFGTELAHEVGAMFDRIPPARLESRAPTLAHYGPFPTGWGEPGSVITVPLRIYNDPITDSTYDSLSQTQRLLADCWHSRSHDGYVRQRHLQRIVSAEEHWVVPYVVAALGDYVVEVAQEVETGLTEIDQPSSWQHHAYRAFAAQNHAFIRLVRQRAMSYWNEYYSATYSRDGASTNTRPVYPAFAVLDKLGDPHPRFFRLHDATQR